MSPEIHFLSDDCIDQIAAGEVIERPASVVKELVENSLDAGARRISVRLEEGGKELIRVSDDGCGISPSGIGICALRHTTSKISSAAELFGLRTNGFRGEALASIAAVSRMTIESRVEEAEAGARLVLVPGEEPRRSECARERGTTVEVESLFCNAPVRAKFLSGAPAETSRILDVLQRLALANPDVAFRLSQGGRDLLLARPGTPELRVKEILDPELARNLLPVDREEDGVRVAGFVGNEETLRARRVHQYLFVDRRPVWNAALFKAIAQGTAALHGNPAAVLFFSLPAEDVDVNVHPAKREVRFARESRLFEITVRALRDALAGRVDWTPGESVPAGGLAEPARPWPAPAEPPRAEGSAAPSAGRAAPAPRAGGPGDPGAATGALARWKNFAWTAKAEPDEETKSLARDLFAEAEQRERVLRMPDPGPVAPDPGAEPAARFLQVGGAYLVAAAADGALLVDQRAAHQRILFEQARRRMQSRENRSQQLLFPELLELSPAQSQWVERSLDALALLGFEIEPFGTNSWQMRATPPEMTPGAAAATVKGMASDPEAECGELDEALCDRLALSFAKKASIDERELSAEEGNALLDDLFRTGNPYIAPDGSSIVLKLSLARIRECFRKGDVK